MAGATCVNVRGFQAGLAGDASLDLFWAKLAGSGSRALAAGGADTVLAPGMTSVAEGAALGMSVLLCGAGAAGWMAAERAARRAFAGQLVVRQQYAAAQADGWQLQQLLSASLPPELAAPLLAVAQSGGDLGWKPGRGLTVLRHRYAKTAEDKLSCGAIAFGISEQHCAH